MRYQICQALHEGRSEPGQTISGCQQGLDADVLPDAASYALPPPMAQTQENLREDPSAILFFRSKSRDHEKYLSG